MVYDEIINLKNKILNNEITVADARALYFDSIKKKSWQTDDWKARRKNIIKNNCEICGSDEILTLQHRSHPKKYPDHKREVESAYTRQNQSDVIISEQELINHIENNFLYQPIDLCPKCRCRKPNKRMRKKPQYLCTECRFEFEEPVYKTINEIVTVFHSGEDSAEIHDKCFISKDEYRNSQNIKVVVYWFKREKVKAKYKDEIERETFLNYLDDNIKYLSFEDTMTCCKKCASYHDLNNMDLCPKCKQRYKRKHYSSCIQCLPEDKRKAALEKIEFGKAWKDLHEYLGID